jgi:thiosulfate/3-mercaptopyruvate sulfurtransferase
MCDKLIDLTNIDTFIKNGGKFLYTNSDAGKWKTYMNKHIHNAIFFGAMSLRSSNTCPVDNCKEDGILPVQQIDVKNINRMLKNSRLSKNDKICVYGDNNTKIEDTLFVYYTLNKFGLKMYYLNLDWTTLPDKYLTQEIPVYKKICERYKYSEHIINSEDVVKESYKENTKIIDVRPPTAYTGENKIFPINGHIPTADNLFWMKLMIPSSDPMVLVIPTFQSKEYIENLLTTAGISKYNDIIVYCNSGSELTVMFFALTEILGWKKLKAYQGSWSVYQYLSSQCPNKYKVATGSSP